MKIVIDISEDIFTRLFDNGSDADIDDLRAIETAARNGKLLNDNAIDLAEDELEEIKTEMCDNYCRKRDEWIGDPDEFIDKICTECPLSRL